MKNCNVYVSKEAKKIRGSIHGIKNIEVLHSGFIFTFSNSDRAYHAAQVFMNSGYETVRQF
jgi:hypothetical protein